MRRFCELCLALDATTSTQAKVEAMAGYLAAAPAADAAWAAWFLAGGRLRRVVPSARLRALTARLAGLPDWLFEECYQAVGDLAETIAHLLPPAPTDGGTGREESLAWWVARRLQPLAALRDEALDAALVQAWDALDAGGRFVWNKLITGGFRLGVSRGLVTRAVARAAGLPAALVAERLVGDWTPSAEAWQALVAPPSARDEGSGRPYPFFLAHALDGHPSRLGPVADWQAEWKWDGIRAQLVRRGGRAWLWTRGEELVTDRFPELEALGRALPDGTVLDGELLAWQDDAPLPFARLQARIGRRRLGPAVLARAPVVLLAYDLLEHAGEDIRTLGLAQRRARLEALAQACGDTRLRLSPVLEIGDWADAAGLRDRARACGVEGLMLKRRAAPYGAGRVKLGPAGEWWKWKTDPYCVDAVLVYAQRGHGRRAGLYTDYTFAVWRDGDLVPFAKAYSGLDDAEIRAVDAFIRRHTREKFGPVRSVEPALVMEIGFEGIAPSPRHRSGVAVRFPRILRWRHDKSPAEADRLEALLALAGGVPG